MNKQEKYPQWKDTVVEDKKIIPPHYYTGKKSHKQNVPKTAKKWSLKQPDYALLRFGFFWEMVKKQ